MEKYLETMNLQQAARLNNIQRVESLLRDGVEVNSLNILHQTALYYACKHGHEQPTELLLSAGADPDIGAKPLNAAIVNCRNKCVEILLRNRANVNAASCTEKSPLFVACERRNYTVAELLVDKGADINFSYCNGQDNPVHISDVFFRNAGRDQFEFLDKLLIQGLELKSDNKTVLAASRYAFKYAMMDFAIKMLAIESDINVKEHYSFALHTCALHDWPNVALILLDKGINVNEILDGETALYIACREGHSRIVELLVRYGAVLNKSTDQQHSSSTKSSSNYHADPLIHVAFDAGGLASCKALLPILCKEDVCCCDRHGMTVLHKAAMLCDTEAVQFFVDKFDIDIINAADQQLKCSALHFACGADVVDNRLKDATRPECLDHSSAVVKLLLENGANANAVSGHKTPLYYVARVGDVEAACLLFDAGAKLDIADTLPPLIPACELGHTEIVRLLLDKGADADARNTSTCRPLLYSVPSTSTPLCIAINGRRADIIELLLNHGASVNRKSNGQTPLFAFVGLFADALKQQQIDLEPSTALHVHQVTETDRLMALFLRILNAVDDVNYRVDIESYSQPGTALERACVLGLPNIIDILLKHCSLNSCDIEMLIFFACRSGKEEVVQLLVNCSPTFVIEQRGYEEGLEPAIMAATRTNNLAIIKMILDCRGVDVNDCPLDVSQTALHLAGSRAAVELLISAGADVRASMACSDVSPLDAACERGMAEVVEALLDAGASPCKDGVSKSLFIACKNNHVEILRLLLNHGVDPNCVERARSSRHSANKPSALCIACSKGFVSVVRMLLEAGACVNYVVKQDGKSPLIYALERCKPSVVAGVESNHLRIVDILLDNTADVNVTASDGVTPLHLASVCGLTSVVVKLFHNGASWNRLLPWLPLVSSVIKRGHVGVYEALIRNIGHIEDSVKLLHIAIEHVNINIVSLLLARGVNPNGRRRGQTALHSALLLYPVHGKKSEAIIRVLLAASADVNILCEVYGARKTALDIACDAKLPLYLVELLLRSGADPNKVLGAALTTAVSRGRVALVELLLAYGANPHCVDEYKTTLLHQLLHRFRPPTRSTVNRCKISSKHKTTTTVGDNLTCRTSSYSVVSERYMSTLRLLLSVGVNVNAVDEFQNTPLCIATKRKLFDAVAVLLRSGADPNLVTANTFPLCIAVKRRDAELIRLLLESGASANNNVKPINEVQKLPELGSYSRGMEFERRRRGLHSRSHTLPLFIALRQNNMQAVELLLQHGADANLHSIRGHLPLGLLLSLSCSGRDNIALANVLLSHKADPNLTSRSGLSPFHMACLRNQLDMVQIFLSHNADVNQRQTRMSPLIFACQKSHTAILQLLLRSGADPNLGSSLAGCSLPDEFPTCLAELRLRRAENFQLFAPCAAALLGEYKTVKMLLEHGADVNVGTESGMTALHAAVSYIGRWSQKPTHREILKLLLDSGADVNALDVSGQTPLYLAAGNGPGCVDIVELLLSRGADPNLTTRSCFPLCAACSAKDLRVVELLLDHGAHVNPLQIPSASKLNEFSRKAPTLPLGCAAAIGCVKLMKLLLQRGAEVNLMDSTGCTALHCACYRFNNTVNEVIPIITTSHQSKKPKPAPQCISLLLENGASVNIAKQCGKCQLAALGIILSTFAPSYFSPYRSRSCRVAINEVIHQLISRGAVVSDSPTNLGRIHRVSLLDFLITDIRRKRFVAYLLKAGTGFRILSLYSKAMSKRSVSLSTDIIGRAAVLAGYKVEPTDVMDLAMADGNLAAAELARWLEAFQCQPPKLMIQCRVAIRRQLSAASNYSSILPAIAALTLPAMLEQYLMFDVLSEVDPSLVTDMDASDEGDDDDGSENIQNSYRIDESAVISETWEDY